MFTLRHIEIHGHDVAYRLAGEGETILLIHGMAGSSRTWREVMPGLAERHRVLAPDLLGHGASGKTATDYSLGAHASVLRDLIDRLGIERATVVGQSLGGGVAMQLAYQYPDAVSASCWWRAAVSAVRSASSCGLCRCRARSSCCRS